jgi:phosphomethylpyrimidine synthase
MTAGMREKSEEFLAAGGKVYLPELLVPANAGTRIRKPGTADAG